MKSDILNKKNATLFCINMFNDRPTLVVSGRGKQVSVAHKILDRHGLESLESPTSDLRP